MCWPEPSATRSWPRSARSSIGYPLAYFIAMRGGRYKNALLALVVLPFFTTYLIRTIAWRVLLTQRRPVPGSLRAVGILDDNSEILGRPVAVIGALIYNFLPFMVLPIYVTLEKVDRRLLEAGPDLYASSARTFRKVTLPLSIPGCVRRQPADVHPGRRRLHQLRPPRQLTEHG